MSHNLSLPNPNPDARGNGQEHDTCGLSLSPEQFFQKNHKKLLSHCHRIWNGSGEEVFWEAVSRSIEYEYMTSSLFRDLCRGAAKALKVSRWQHTSEGTVILPPTRRQTMKCEKCGSTKFTDTLGFQKMCVCCGEKVDPPAPVFDLTEDEDNEDVDIEKLNDVEENTLYLAVQEVINAVKDGQNLTEAVKKAGITYHNFRKKARQAWVQPSLFSVKNSTSDAYISGGAR